MPKQHLQNTLARLEKINVTVAVAQATLPCQNAQPVPAAFRQIVYKNCQPMFLKENLWNLAADLLLDCEKLLFLDSDINLTGNWLRAVSDALDTHDIIQPFEKCQWLDRAQNSFRELSCAAVAVSRGEIPYPSIFHPGFGLAMTRAAYNRLGGLYEKMIAGGGDIAFWFAMLNNPKIMATLIKRDAAGETNTLAPSYLAYRENALRQHFSIGFVPDIVAAHFWHGERQNRNYLSREKFFPKFDNKEPAVMRRPDGLLMFTRPAPFAQEYFELRKEDG